MLAASTPPMLVPPGQAPRMAASISLICPRMRPNVLWMRIGRTRKLASEMEAHRPAGCSSRFLNPAAVIHTLALIRLYHLIWILPGPRTGYILLKKVFWFASTTTMAPTGNDCFIQGLVRQNIIGRFRAGPLV